MRHYSPFQNMIMAGLEQTKLTSLRMIGKMDTESVYTKKQLLLVGEDQEIYVREGGLSAEIIEWMVEDESIPIEHSEEVVLFRRMKTPLSAWLRKNGITEPRDPATLSVFVHEKSCTIS
jgi:hypothetical protein